MPADRHPCHRPGYPSASSSLSEHWSPATQELQIYPAKSQGSDCLLAAQLSEIQGENEISLAHFRSWVVAPHRACFKIPAPPLQLPDPCRELPVALQPAPRVRGIGPPAACQEYFDEPKEGNFNPTSDQNVEMMLTESWICKAS